MRIREPDADQISNLTDWVEAHMVVGVFSKASKTRLKKLLRENAFEDSELDIYIEMAFSEMERRSEIAGGLYPFYRENTGWKYSGIDGSIPYIFLLCISVSEDFRSARRQNDVEGMLDYLVLDALKGYLSDGTNAIHFGWPVTGGRPTRFEDAVKWLAKKMNLPLGTGRKRVQGKDGGVDAVIWKPFRDNRAGFIVILTQCTVTFDWFEKRKDIVVDVWRSWIDLGKDPFTCLAIPFVIPAQFDKWDELRRSVTIVLDRLRLCELLAKSTLTQEASISDWLQSEIAIMQDQ